MSRASSPSCDVLVIGAGASGLTAAITARKAGLEVIILEKQSVFGGTTALSGATLWIPLNDHDAALGAVDSPNEVKAYLKQVLGNRYDERKITAFLDNGAEMVRFLETESEAKFEGALRPEYYPELPGSGLGRSIQTADYSVRALGPAFRNLRGMLPQTLFMGIAVGSSIEMRKYFTANRSVGSLLFVLGKLCLQGIDLIRYGRSGQLPRGGGLVGRLMRTVIDLDIPVWLSSAATKPILQNGRVAGAEVATPDGTVTVVARRGVILACGGFPADSARRADTFGHSDAEGGLPAILAPTGNTGDGIRFGEAAGGVFDAGVIEPAAWMPVSVIPGRKREEAAYPHIVDRQKPGFIAVSPQGKRFVNEAGSYHDFVPAMIRASPPGLPPYAFLLCDRPAINRWGLGYVKPAPVPRGGHIRSGYLLIGRNLRDLAAKMGIDPMRLEQTVADFNDQARKGKDPWFHRGESAFDRFNGDPAHKPNPNLGPLERGPFYAVRLVPGEIATFAGLKTDAAARVVGPDGTPVSGLYAVGNDMASIMGGSYPAAGITLGPGMTFAYIAARHLAQGASTPQP